MRDLRKEFPVAGHHAYFDTPSSGLMYESLLEWRSEHDLDFLLGGSLFRQQHKKFLNTVREKTARFFGGKPENTALIPNFSFGFNVLLEGLPRPKKILLLKEDYPSITWAVQLKGFEIFYAEADEFAEDNIAKAIQEFQPDVFIFSMVQYISGIKIDFDFLKEIKEKHPDLLLIADGTQYLGTERFHFEDSAMDVLAASGYKWLLAGYGNGFLMVKDTAKEYIFPKTVGFNSTDYMNNLEINPSFITHFEPGHQDTLCYGSLGFSLDFLKNIGMDEIENQTKTLSKKAKEAFSELGFLEDAVANRKNHSTIFNLKGGDKLFQYLHSNNVICTPRGNGIRVGFHFYNTEQEVGNLAVLLKKYK